MKLDLIRDNLALCEQALKEEQIQAATEHACNTVRLLLQRITQWQENNPTEAWQKNYISLAGIAGAVQGQIDLLKSKQDLGELPQKLRDRIAQIQKEFANAEQEYNTLTTLHKDLLAEKEKLQKEKKTLEEQKKLVAELIDVKENQLAELREQIDLLSKNLHQLEDAYANCESLYLAVQNELTENLAILTALPSSTGSNVLDALIEQSKQQQKTLEDTRDTIGEPLRQIIEKVRELEAMAEGKP